MILFFQENDYIDNGLTIPFLIGASEIIEGKPLSLKSIVVQLTNKNQLITPSIMKCETIGEIVVGVLDNESVKSYSTLGDSKIKRIGKLTATDSSLDSIISLKDLFKLFYKAYSVKLKDGYYSKNNGVWGKFDKTDRDRLNHFKEHYLD